MGICCSVISKESIIDTKINDNKLDKIIIISYSFMKNKITEDKIESVFPILLYSQLIEEKAEIRKTRNFFKWINMSTKFKKVIISFDINSIINSLKRQQIMESNDKLIDKKEDEDYLKNKGLSYTETGLRFYYSKNKIIFENMVLNSPSGVFRWISWIILCKIPDSRDNTYYNKLIGTKIKERKKNEILLEIEDTIIDKGSLANGIKSRLFRLLKSLRLIDHDIIELKEISYIMGFLLMISDIDELNVYYFMISLLSKTFSDNFGIRGFYIRGEPLLKACTSVFQKNFCKYFPELSEHFLEINFSFEYWISFWIKMCYINIFPNYLLLRIWDYFLIYGIPFLLSLGFSIVECFYEDLINNDKPENIVEFFKKLNPNLKSNYKRFEVLEYNIEDLISNAIKNYPITNNDINEEIKILFPDYENNFKYQYQDNNQNIQDNSESSSLIEENNPTTVDKIYVSEQDNSQNILSFINSNETYGVLEENKIENIELSISQYKYNVEDYYSDNSCEEIEDENITLNEHIKDLMNKQKELSKTSNLIS